MYGTVDLRDWRWIRPIERDGVIVRTESDDVQRWVIEALTLHIARRAWDQEQKEKVLTIKPVIHNGEPAVTLEGEMAGSIIIDGNVYQPDFIPVHKDAYKDWVVKTQIPNFVKANSAIDLPMGLAAAMDIELEDDGKTVKNIKRITSLTLTNNPPDPNARIISGRELGEGRILAGRELKAELKALGEETMGHLDPLMNAVSDNPWEGGSLDPNKEIAEEKARIQSNIDNGLTEDGFPLPLSCPHHKSNVVDCDVCMGRGIWYGVRGADPGNEFAGDVTHGC